MREEIWKMCGENRKDEKGIKYFYKYIESVGQKIERSEEMERIWTVFSVELFYLLHMIDSKL